MMTPGSRVGPYEISSTLGQGGMGVVFRARDTRLHRDVAIKVLPDPLAVDPDRLARFQREAQVLATLNHPNIAQIYGLEQSGASTCIVMELVEGETLDECLKRGPLPVEETIAIARQLIEALSTAHDRGIIHRDLKPGNIKLTPDGKAKVLDFGLAKVAAPEASSNISQSPTMITGSVAGVILGTAAYMSPEQARGRETDSRTDVWAFGCVVYEMLTGRQAFYGETVTDIIAKIIEAEPKWDALPPGTPQSLRRLLRATLHKDLKQRLQHIGDSRLFLDGTLTSDASPVSQSRSFTRRTWLAAAGGLAAGALLPTAAYFLRRTEQPRNAFRFERPAAGLVGNTLAISPDGEYVGYIVVTDGRRSIWTGPLGGEAKLLSGTQGSSGFFWSPDSSQIAFFQEQQLKKMVRSGGNVTVIRPSIVVPPNASGSWGPDGTILVSLIRPPTLAPMMHRISERGGEPVPITENDSEQPVAQGTPQFLPDGQHYLFHEVSISAPGRTTVRVGSLHSKDVVDVMTLESALSSPVKYAEPGYFLFSMSGTLMAQRFDVRSLKVLGTPLPVVEQITSAFSASNNGRLVYAHTSGNETPQRPHQLSWFDRNGKPAGQLGEPSTYTSVALSRDERKLAVAVGSGANRDIYVFDVDRGTRERLTSADAPDSIPVWEPAGGSDRIVFASQRGDNPIRPPKLYIRASTSVGQDTLLYEGNPSEGSLPQDWCTEGILFVSRAGLNAISWDLWLQPPTPGQEPREYLKTAFRKIDAQVSPNGKWVAFTTNETGSDQVVVQAFPDPDLGRRTVTANGGMLPRWRKDGRELYYLAPDRKLMAVSVKDPATMSFGETTTLFATELPTFGTREPTVGVVPYDVADNGQRFLLIASAQSTTTPGGAAGREPSSIHGILDWTSLLKN